METLPNNYGRKAIFTSQGWKIHSATFVAEQICEDVEKLAA